MFFRIFMGCPPVFPVSVQVKDQHNRDLRVIMSPDRFAGVSPLLASTLARYPPFGLAHYRSIGA